MHYYIGIKNVTVTYKNIDAFYNTFLYCLNIINEQHIYDPENKNR